MPPNSPAWARPTLSTTPTSGRRDRDQPGDLADRRSRPSRRRGTRCLRRCASIEIGRADLVVERAPRRDRRALGARASARSRFFVVVLPFDPVIADDAQRAERAHPAHDLGRERAERVDAVGDDELRARRGRAARSTIEQRGARLDGGRREQVSVGRPRRACAKKMAPRRRPARESVSTVPATTRLRRGIRAGERCSAPPSAAASSARSSAITPSPPRAAPRVRSLAGRVRRAARPRCRGSPGGRVRPRGSSRPRRRATTALRIAASGGLTS